MCLHIIQVSENSPNMLSNPTKRKLISITNLISQFQCFGLNLIVKAVNEGLFYALRGNPDGLLAFSLQIQSSPTPVAKQNSQIIWCNSGVEISETWFSLFKTPGHLTTLNLFILF